MNVHTDKSGSVSQDHIEKSGFEIFATIDGSDMGQMCYSLPQFTNGDIQIIGGYWNYIIKDIKTGKKLWEGWWNSNKEFDETIKNIKK